MKERYIYTIIKDSPCPGHPKIQVAFNDLERAKVFLSSIGDRLDEVISKDEKIMDGIEMGRPVCYYIQPVIIR